ncbi:MULTISPECIES: murein hydrolase activator EnvC family protein [Bacillaceae]|uniref:Peptidoglycan DD-metalloendopeptidase family protein n=1 Tax=Evansella alkalicola TaxID=745819 RepID=A0ABS6JUK1_9BACI|nr:MULTISPECIES: peptidoglycan DD-metalloendopeptidase family protein [Bacillaceae]MBU9722258.1 peptidoglycan DD-metalloendopeptidase family protein [Bacillus alkalicola]
MDRRLLLVSLVLLLTLVPYAGKVFISTAEANTGQELEEQIDTIKEQQSELQNEADKTEGELQEVEAEVKVMEADLRRLDEEMAATNLKIDDKQEEIDETKERIEDLRQEIVVLEKRIAQRDELLKDRVRSMYKNGGTVHYIEVILGARSFGDLIERVTALNTIAQQDRNILEQHVADKNALEVATHALESELAGLESQMKELESLRNDLEDQKDEKDVVIEALVRKGINLEEQLMSYEEEQQFLKAQEEATKKELELWEEEQRRLEEERKRQEEEERKRQEELKRQQEEEERKKQEQAKAEEEAKSNSGTGGNSGGSTGSGTSGGSTGSGSDNTTVSNGSGNSSATLFRPSDGRVTSNFNPNRLHPIYGYVRPHNGIDYGRDGGLNIYAAEAGTVIQTSWMGGFGNTILISHIIDGQPYTTLYAHLASFNVSPGQRVSRGQVIGVMGTTGSSTGVHLHFEVHPGGYRGGSSAVNPNPYLN